MKKTTKVVLAVLVAAMLLLGIGYAAISQITLTIAGTATAQADSANFKVMFTDAITVSDSTKVTATKTNDTNATIAVSGLTTVGQTATATYTVQNTSTDISADINVATTNDNTEYFRINAKIGDTRLDPAEATTVTVTITLLKSVITDNETATVGVQLTAYPVEPGSESTPGISDESTTALPTLSSVTNDNIGDYIDLKNNVVGTESTADDWRMLYKEGETVYAILADYLPNSTGYATAAGLDTSNTYNVYSNTDRNTLLSGLTDSADWEGLANGLEGALVTGAPTAELLMKSYNTKNGTSLDYTSYQTLNSNDGLYYISDTKEDTTYAYWLASPYAGDDGGVWYVDGGGAVNTGSCNGTGIGVRPVVALPSDILAEQVDGVWTVK